MKASRVRTLYVLREDATEPKDARPSVHVERTVNGTITYGVRVSGRSASDARKRAEAEFRALAAFVRQLKGEETTTP